MFKENKYSRIYGEIIERARTRELTNYCESHHIIPESLGGQDTQSNRVNLTAREHFICHKLLTKFTVGIAKSKMVFALHSMMFRSNAEMNRFIPSSRFFETLRIEHSHRISELMSKPKSEEHLAKIREANSKRTKGKSLEEQHDEKKAQEIKDKMSASHANSKNGMFGKQHSPESKEKMSASKLGNNYGLVGENHPLYGRTRSEETKKKISEGGKKRPKKPIIIDGIRYDSINQACELLGKTYSHLYNKIISPKHQNAQFA